MVGEATGTGAQGEFTRLRVSAGLCGFLSETTVRAGPELTSP